MLPMDTRTCSDMSESKEEEEEGFEFRSAKKKRIEFVGGPRQAGCGGVCCGSGGVAAPLRCQAQGCEVDLTEARRYFRRNKVCEVHAKAVAVIVAGLRQRFCQQCSRFHELSEFDDTKRSCRRRLAGHNERRRRSSTEYQGGGSSAHRRPGTIFLN